MSTVSTQSATLTQPAASATSTVILAAGAARKCFIIVNGGSTALSIAFAPTASLAAYTATIAVNGYYECPVSVYGGVVSGIWAGSPGGNAIVTAW